MKLFSDAEDGTYDKLASGFFTISDNLPAGSDLNFKFDLDENETFRVSVKVVKTGKSTRVVLGRGNKDTSCLTEISSALEDVMSNTDIDENNKTTFVAKIQKVIETIQGGKLESDDPKWADLEQQVKMAKQLAMTQEEKENKLGEILASVLLNNFARYLDPADRNDMKAKLDQLKSTTDKFEKESLQQELQDIAEQYGILLNIFMFKIAEKNAQNAQDAARASTAVDEMMNALNNQDIATINQIQSDNKDLLDKMNRGGKKIDWGTKIGG